jgi:hypothetical protein
MHHYNIYTMYVYTSLHASLDCCHHQAVYLTRAPAIASPRVTARHTARAVLAALAHAAAESRAHVRATAGRKGCTGSVRLQTRLPAAAAATDAAAAAVRAAASPTAGGTDPSSSSHRLGKAEGTD